MRLRIGSGCYSREGDSCELSVYKHTDFAEWTISKGRSIGQVAKELVCSVEVLEILAYGNEHGEPFNRLLTQNSSLPFPDAYSSAKICTAF